ncbi:MAG: hypothetical protein M0Z46_15870 [Actinomycetota bacterium]|jgi:hypothetical protein|nr:hypothetical protein [Actinomycetota bacterium]
MRFAVDLDKVVVVLVEPQDVARASVVVTAPQHATRSSEATVQRLADVLAATNVGSLEPDGTVRLSAEAVRFHAAGQVDDDWDRRFADVCGAGSGGAEVVVAPAEVVWPGPC